jgi:hypothetical protein
VPAHVERHAYITCIDPFAIDATSPSGRNRKIRKSADPVDGPRRRAKRLDHCRNDADDARCAPVAKGDARFSGVAVGAGRGSIKG